MVRMIITWSLHNRMVVLTGTLLLVIAGLYSANNLNVEAYPDPTPPLGGGDRQKTLGQPRRDGAIIGIPIETSP